MQYYTRQQLQGSIRYVPSVLIGNWNEEKALEESQLYAFLGRKERGELKLDRYLLASC